VRLVFRHYPLESVHPHALAAAQAAEAAAAQGKFWQMHDRLFEYQNHLDTKHLHAYARELGLEMARFVAEMDDTIYLQHVREHIESGKRSGVRATPTFFVNSVICDVSSGMASLFTAVERELEGYEPYPAMYRICPPSGR
jgi:protein-disulfide isomerase